MNFAVMAFGSIAGKWFVISRHTTIEAAERAARKAIRWHEVKIEKIA